MKHISSNLLSKFSSSDAQVDLESQGGFYGNNQTRYTGCSIRVAFCFFESFQNKIVIKRTQSKKIFSISGIVHNESLLTSLIQKSSKFQIPTIALFSLF